MSPTPSEMTHTWPFVVYATSVFVVVGAMLALSWLLGERHKDRARNEPFESGIVTTGSARLRLSAKFYLVAMFFVIFDLEAVFILAWAIGLQELGWAGYIEIAVFIGVLLATLVYLWRLGALDWGPATRTIKPKTDKQER
jgi:NADH-quinone oxidoreductase subunit A